MREPLVVTPGQGSAPLNIVGEQVTVLAAGAETGSYEIFHQAGPEGSGPPPHNHPWDEAFYVTKGQITFGIEERVTTAAVGTLVHLPAGTTHWFRFGKGGGEMISVTSREGASRMFADLDREIAADKPDLGKLVEVGKRHGLTVPMPAR